MNDITNYSKYFRQIQKNEGVWIYQDAWFYLGRFDKDFTTDYKIKKEGNGIYIFVIKGSFIIDDEQLNQRDGMGIGDVSFIKIEAQSQDAEILIMEVPV